MENHEFPVDPPQPPLPKRRIKPVLTAAVALVTAAAIGGGIYLSVSSKSPMETAFENCVGKKSFSRVFAAEADKKGIERDKAQEGEEAENDEEDGIAQYFDGVLALEDDGRTLVINTLGQDDDPLGLGSFTAQCVYLDLDTPTWIQESVATTRALDGRQSAEWPGHQAQWSYHPNSGLSMIITLSDN